MDIYYKCAKVIDGCVNTGQLATAVKFLRICAADLSGDKYKELCDFAQQKLKMRNGGVFKGTA